MSSVYLLGGLAMVALIAALIYGVIALREAPAKIRWGSVGVPFFQMLIVLVLLGAVIRAGYDELALLAAAAGLLSALLDAFLVRVLKRVRDDRLVAYQQVLIKSEELEQSGRKESVDHLKARTERLHRDLLTTLDQERQNLHAGTSLDYEQILRSPFMNKCNLFVKDLPLGVLLQSKLSLCEKNGIAVELAIDEDGLAGMSSLDSCSLFANLFDNAINACAEVFQSERFIKIDARTKGVYCVVKMKNSCQPEASSANTRQKTGSTQEDLLREHGWGLQILAALAQRYDGSFSTERTDFTFETTVILRTANEHCIPQSV